jgi:DNA-binding SARP family transcriptional activator/predicted ATPase/class 3 adenylate cyclase
MARLRLYLLGPPRIERDGEPIKVDTRKAIALLAHIAITGESHRRDSLVNLLWPEYDQAHGRAALRRTLSALRKALAGKWLDTDRESVGLNPNADVWLDVNQFRSHLDECLTHGHPATQVCPACLSPLTNAVDLYRDDFLSGFSLKDSFNFDDWQFFQADGLRREMVSALARLVQCHTVRGEFESAIGHARHWLALDRLDESAHHQLMQLYAWSDQRSAALRQYQECVRILRSALGVAPQESTTALFQAIQEGCTPPPPVDRRFLHPGEREHRETPPPSEASPVVPGEEKRIVTVVCADVSGSFHGVGDITSEDQAALIRRFLEVVENGLVRYGGRVDRVLGARVLGVFGATQAHESDPELAIRAAIEIRGEAERLGLSVTAGVNTGEVYLSKAGADEHPEYTLMGTVVDLAARLAGKARAGQILVGAPTHRLTWRAFDFTPLSLDIKGTEGPVAAYEVEHLLPHPKKARGIEGLRAALIGRDEEFAKLKDAFVRVLEGQGQIVTLVGEAGVGKSRLVAELKEVALAPDDGRIIPLWLEGRCLELGTAASYAPFIDILQGHFAWGAQDDNRRRREHILSSLHEMVGRGDLPEERSEEIYPLLCRLLSVRLEDEWQERLEGDSPEQIRRQTFVAIYDFFVALSQQQPVLLVFEDLHWADDLSLDLISLLMEGLRLGPMFLLCVYRPEREHKCWHLGTIASQKCRERYTELRLRELTLQQGQQLVESLLTTEVLPPTVKNLILNRSQGNPFFIEEVVRSLIDKGIIYHDDGYWRAQQEVDSVVIPESVQSVILSRLDHLDLELKSTLQVAAVMGRVFRRRVLKHASQRGAGLENALRELEDYALIYQERSVPEAEYSFKHVLTQETVYRNILRRHRQGSHVRVAEAIEALYPENLEEYYEQLAYHYEEGGNAEKAIEYLHKAGSKALYSSANEAAIAHLTRGLELLKTLPETPERIQQELDLQIALGVPMAATKGYTAPETEGVYSRARELCGQVGETPLLFPALYGLWRLYAVGTRLQTAHELAKQLMVLAQTAQNSALELEAHRAMGCTLFHLGELVSARTHLEQGIALYNPRRHRLHSFLYGHDPAISCLAYVSWTLWLIGYPDQGLKSANELLALAQDLAHPFSLGYALAHCALFHQFQGKVEKAQQLAKAAITLSTEQGFPFWLAMGTVLQGWALTEQGREEEGIAQMRQGLATWQATRIGIYQSYYLALLAKACERVGRVKEGLRLLTEALTIVDEIGERTFDAELYRLKGELLLKRNESDKDIHDAETCFQRAIEIARHQSARSWELRAATSLSRLWQKQGKKEQARELLQETYNWFTEGFDTADLKEANTMLDALV